MDISQKISLITSNIYQEKYLTENLKCLPKDVSFEKYTT